MSRLVQIMRYPVKGLRGEELAGADLAPGAGLPYDRALAIENGTTPPTAGWASREAFFHLAKDAHLIRHAATVTDDISGPTARLDVPGAGEFEVRLREEHRDADLAAVNAELARVLPPGREGPPRLTMRGTGMWDYEDTVLSLMNLDTVAELGERAGRPVDPRRFRSNLYVEGLGAWEEFALTGRLIRVGTAVLQVMFPTDRCRATTVDPDSGDTELNLPAVLASRLGHMYCGVYAKVVGAGRIEPGSALAIEDESPARDYPSTVDTRRWPRRVEVTSTTAEARDVTSIWLRDPLGYAASAVPGQHLRLHPAGVTDTPLWRCYTISAVDGDAYRISVKRDGAVSALLHDAIEPGAGLVMSGPFGSVTLDETDTRPLLLVSAGIGLTPTVAMLRGLSGAATRELGTSESTSATDNTRAATRERGTSESTSATDNTRAAAERPVRVVQVDRDPTPTLLWDEVESVVATLPAAAAQRYVTRPGREVAPASGTWRPGRPKPADLQAVVAELPANPVAYVCGPDGFFEAVRSALVDAGVDADSVRHEVFFSPSTQRSEPRPPPEPGPFEVTFADPADEDMVGVWDDARGSLLDVGESLGLPMPSGCRAGACGSCALRVTAGTTAYVTDPASPAPDGTVLLCSTVPTSDVTVALTPS